MDCEKIRRSEKEIEKYTEYLKTATPYSNGEKYAKKQIQKHKHIIEKLRKKSA